VREISGKRGKKRGLTFLKKSHEKEKEKIRVYNPICSEVARK